MTDLPTVLRHARETVSKWMRFPETLLNDLVPEPEVIDQKAAGLAKVAAEMADEVPRPQPEGME
jgi:hypothetical protein